MEWTLKSYNLWIAYRTASFEDLDYLTVDQGMADYATLIGTVIRDLEANNPRVIVWGIGIGGTIALMARKKYPHLVHGAWASSGLFGARVIDTSTFIVTSWCDVHKLIYFKILSLIIGYYDNLSNIIRYSGSVQCAERLHTAFDVLENLIENAEVEYLTERLRLCAPIDTTNEQEVAVLLYRFIDLIAQYIRAYK